MSAPIKLISQPHAKVSVLLIGKEIESIEGFDITNENTQALNAPLAEWQKVVSINEQGNTVIRTPLFDGKGNRSEHFRLVGAEIWGLLKSSNQTEVQILNGDVEDVVAIVEGLWLKNYRFENYKSKKDGFQIEGISILNSLVRAQEVKELIARVDGTCFARDLVNEPANILTATELANRIKIAGKTAGYDTEILGKTKIEALKMGGLLSVNQGSTKDPSFSIIEYNPANAKNKQPIVFVGKGIVYDTGGLSLKPTAGSMDIMKCDMGGAAAVAGAIYAVAAADLPVHIIGLIPATDNQPAPDAYQPGDVITMYDGTQVEVMNTDAEGRLVLADALSYAKKLKPELAFDFATLTGSSMRALGYYAGAAMGTAGDETLGALKAAGTKSWERVVEFPLWDDYASDLKSDIADMRNLGPTPFADVIIAGKFLQHFTDFPWVHVDIAGPAFLPSGKGYLPKGGTGFGVNLLFHFLKDYKA